MLKPLTSRPDGEGEECQEYGLIIIYIVTELFHNNIAVAQQFIV